MAQGPVATRCYDGCEASVQRLRYEPAFVTRSEGFTKGKPRHVLLKQRQIRLLDTSAAPPS